MSSSNLVTSVSKRLIESLTFSIPLPPTGVLPEVPPNILGDIKVIILSTIPDSIAEII